MHLAGSCGENEEKTHDKEYRHFCSSLVGDRLFARGTEDRAASNDLGAVVLKLAAKLTAFILAAMLLVFGVRGYQAARRQMANAETRARENALLLGRALRPALVEIWNQEGSTVALEMLSYAADRVRRTQPFDLRFVRMSEANGPGVQPLVRLDQLAGLDAKGERVFVEKVAGNETLLTYLSVSVKSQQVGCGRSAALQFVQVYDLETIAGSWIVVRPFCGAHRGAKGQAADAAHSVDSDSHDDRLARKVCRAMTLLLLSNSRIDV